MCGLVGLSAGAGPAILPPTLEGYDHADLKRSFQQIVGFFDDLLATIREEHRRLTFDDVGGAFDLAMRPRWLSGGSLIVGVVPGAGVAESEVVTWFERSLIAATTRMATARERRVRGCGRRQVLAPEAMGLAPRRSEVIFAIDVDTQYLQEGDTLQIVHPVHGERGRPREVVLYVADQT
jgi:predicted component of type VI protein secretion system